ncbi:aldehyde dehydrogenase [Actinoallomurus vinaceus]|uniref:Aldehyde dehydrogenase n=1 Tax=Actinoallomurus vinaceus TaxID=1080074 RepID=A0ABP8UDY0_9ACTN
MQYFPDLYIDGRWTPPASGDTIDVRSPHNHELVGRAPSATTLDIDRAVSRARVAFDAGPWPRMTPAKRAKYLQRLRDVYAERQDAMVDLIVREVGSPIAWASQTQAAHPLAILDYYIDLASRYSFAEDRGTGTRVFREPVGVAGLITPWNMPQKTIFMKLVPALLAGCTVVIKPAPETPLDALFLAEIVHDVGLPPGVFNVVPADREVSEHLVTHPGVDKIAFTGSTATGRRVAALCGEDIRRVSLELGGKSPAIVLDDADLDAVVDGLRGDAFCNSGQICSNHTRVLVSTERHDELMDRLRAMVASLRVGDPTDPATDVGPLVAKRQLDRVEDYIASGVDEGATLVHGGHRPEHLDRGWYIEPTLFTDVTNDMRIAREEIFGPVLCVIPYSTEREAVGLANDTEYGLEAGVWTSDHQHGIGIARRLRAGTVRINGAAPSWHAPLGGFKQSGYGRELGPEGLAGYLEPKALAVPV